MNAGPLVLNLNLNQYLYAVYVVTFNTISPSICSATGRSNVTVILWPVLTSTTFLWSTCLPLKIEGKMARVLILPLPLEDRGEDGESSDLAAAVEQEK